MNLSRYATMDRNLLPGLVNTCLRNDCQDLHDLLRTHDLDEDPFLERMRDIGYRYCPESNQFRPGPSPDDERRPESKIER